MVDAPLPARALLYPATACILLTLALMCWPGDAPWGGDDVVLISSAIKANQQHQMTTAGLGGSFGYPYGPIPSQIYQLLALISHNPITLVRLHAGLFAGATAVALVYLTGVLKLSRWFAPLTMLGPYFWFYSRLMWDNTFAIPIGTLLLAAYGDYLRRRARSAYFLSAICSIALPLIHPMTLPLVAAVGGHALVYHYRSFKKHWVGLVIIAICTSIIGGPYCKRVALQIGHAAALIPPRDDALTRFGGLLFPFQSGRLFTARGFFDERGPELGLESYRWAKVIRDLSAVSYALIWLGILVAAWRFLLKLKDQMANPRLAAVPKGRVLALEERPFGTAAKQRSRGRHKDCESGPAAVTLARLCLLALVLQSVMDGYLRISPYPHYYTGTWAASVVLLWMGIDWLKAFKLRLPTAIVYATSLAIATSIFAIDIHRQHGGTVWYGPSLQTKLDCENKR